MWSINPVIIAAARGYADFVSLFLDYGYKVSFDDAHKKPLMCAIINEHPNVVKIILSRNFYGKTDNKIFFEVAKTGNIELFDTIYHFIPIVESKPSIVQLMAGTNITITGHENVTITGNAIESPSNSIGIPYDTVRGNAALSSNSVQILPGAHTLLDIVTFLAMFHTPKHINLLTHIIKNYNVQFDNRMIIGGLRNRASVEYFKAIMKRYVYFYIARSSFTFRELLYFLRYIEKDCEHTSHQNPKEIFELFCIVGCNRGSDRKLEEDIVIQSLCDSCTRYYVRMLLLSGRIEIHQNSNRHFREVASEITLFDKCYFDFRRQEYLRELHQ